MAHEIQRLKVRNALKPRREPYWGAPIGRGQVIGFRKIDALRGSWIARQRDESGRKVYKSLGVVSTTQNYERARKRAAEWFQAREAGVTDDTATVADICREYVANRQRHKGDACAHDAEKRFERTVYDTPFGAILLRKLRASQIEDWREGLKLSKAASNRTLTTLRAALNFGVSRRRVQAGAAREWADVKPYTNASQRRTLFLDLAQRQRLLERTQGALRDLVEAAMLTGARAGELTSLRRSAFDGRLGTVTLKGKTGSRTVPLAPAAAALFERLAKGKLPGAWLLMRDDGRPWAHSDWDKLIAEAAQLAKLPRGVCLYTLRHSWITEAISGGMSTLDTARLAGTSVGMVEKHYGHLVADAARERLAKVTML